jgi:hypothetical protein
VINLLTGIAPLVTAPMDIRIAQAAGVILALGSALILYAMVAKVNRRLPAGQQVLVILLNPLTVSRITRDFRRLYPQSRLNTLRIIFATLAFVLIVVSTLRAIHFSR